jgi:hypothetical protein
LEARQVSVVDGECLVVVQEWGQFVTLHAHEEARIKFVRKHLNHPDFSGLNNNCTNYVGVVEPDVWKQVQAGQEVLRAPSQAPLKWTLRQKAKDHRRAWENWDDKEVERELAPWPKDRLAGITTEPAEPVDGDLWLDTDNVQGDTLMKWSARIGAWCYAEKEDYQKVGIDPPGKE